MSPSLVPSIAPSSSAPTLTGILTTIAGTGSLGYMGDNGAATLAKLHSPFGVGLDSSGRVASLQA